MKTAILANPAGVVRPNLRVPVYASWQAAMKDAVREVGQLCSLLGLPAGCGDTGLAACRDFPLFVPRSFLARMRYGDPHDPLLRQVLPLAEETRRAAGFATDPVGDRLAELRPGLLQKYHGRALLVVTGACAVHCRYCFRRHYPYDSVPRTPNAWSEPLAAITADPAIREVIFSGGDPLTIVDEQLAKLAHRIAMVPHVTRLRVHTRLPIMIPERVTEGLLGWLRGTRLAPMVVVHVNHANEIGDTIAVALGRLVDAGIPVLNQTVLLRGVNDSVEAQRALCERLVDLRVLPYYLHQLDRVEGAAHFEVPIDRGRAIVAALRQRLPGYAVPRYVAEVCGRASKVTIA